MDTYLYGQPISNKGVKVTQRGKDSFFQQIVLEEMEIHMGKNEPQYLPLVYKHYLK